MITPAERARRTQTIVERLHDECLRVSRSERWSPPFPDSARDWDPYVRAILFSLAHESTFLDDEVDSLYERLWRQIGSRVCPEFLLAVPARLVVSFASSSRSIVSRGRPLYAAGSSSRPEGLSFMTDSDVEVLPIQWAAGGVLNGGSAYLRVEMPQSGKEFQVPGSIHVFLDRAKTRLTREMLRVLPRTRVSLLDGDQFRLVGHLTPRRDPVRSAYASRGMAPTGDDFYFFELNNLSGWQKSRWEQHERGYWLRLEFDGLAAESVVDKVKDPPFVFNCCTASNIRREHLSLPLDSRGVGFARVGPLVGEEQLVHVESVKIGNAELAPEGQAPKGAPGSYVLDWVPSGTDAIAPQYELLVHVPPAPGAGGSKLRADVSLLVTEPERALSVPLGAINERFPVGDAAFVKVTNVTIPWPGRPGILSSTGIAESVGHIVRTGDRLLTRRDFEHVLRRLDPRVKSVETKASFAPDASGAFQQFVDVTVTVEGLTGETDWLLATLAAFYERELAERSAPNAIIRVSCVT